MLLIPPKILVRMLCPGEFKSLLSDQLPSVPSRTRSRLLSGGTPSDKTVDAVIRDIAAASGRPEEEVRKMLGVPRQPWEAALNGLKTGMGEQYPPELDYAVALILRVEKGPAQAAAALRNGNPRWRNVFQRIGLPQAVMSDKFIKECGHIAKTSKKHKGETIVSIESGRVLLRTNLFLLAAVEVAVKNAGTLQELRELWVHRLLPVVRDNKIIGPMRLFFEAMMQRLDIPGVDALAAKLPTLLIPEREKDFASQKRQLQRWISGRVSPSWEYMRLLDELFFEEKYNFLECYGVARFLQSLFMETSRIAGYFKDRQEVVAIFGEYPQWQAHHERGLAQWRDAREKNHSPASGPA